MHTISCHRARCYSSSPRATKSRLTNGRRPTELNCPGLLLCGAPNICCGTIRPKSLKIRLPSGSAAAKTRRPYERKSIGWPSRLRGVPVPISELFFPSLRLSRTNCQALFRRSAQLFFIDSDNRFLLSSVMSPRVFLFAEASCVSAETRGLVSVRFLEALGCESVSSKAAIARSSRSLSFFKSEMICWMFNLAPLPLFIMISL